LGLTKSALTTFRNRLERVFTSALTSGASELKKGARVHLDDALLECFAGLSSKCKDEEAEDLVYFILDIYQFHGVPVALALAELDIDQVSFSCQLIVCFS
jgi:separase